MVDSKENYKFDLEVKGLSSVHYCKDLSHSQRLYYS